MAAEVTSMHGDCIDKLVKPDACVTIDAKMCTTGLSNTTVFMEAL